MRSLSCSPRLGVAALALWLSGCGPSLSQLARERRYSELTCAVTSESQLRTVVVALLEASAPKYRVVELLPSDLGAARDGGWDAFFAKTRVLAVSADSTPVEGLEMSLRPTLLGSRPERGQRISGISMLVAMTHESMAQGKSTSETTRSFDVEAMKLALLTLGASRFHAEKPIVTTETRTTTTDATAAQIAALAPRAVALAVALRTKVPSDDVEWFAFDADEPIRVAYSLDVMGAKSDCSVAVSHGGDPIKLDSRSPTLEGPYSKDGWTRGSAFRGGEKLEALHGP